VGWRSNTQPNPQEAKNTLGTEITDNIRQDQGDLTGVGNIFTADLGSSTIWALYGQDEFAITHNLTLSAGLRYDHYSNFGGSTNPRLGLIYHFVHQTTLKVLYGTAFRAPEPFELMPDYGPFYDNNPDLKPEIIRSLEAVVEKNLGEHLTLAGSVFQNRIEHLISLETNSANGHSIYENASGAVVTGAEIEFDGRFANGIQGSASYSYASVREASHQTVPNSPQHLGKLNLSIPVVHEWLFASVDGQYTSPVQTLTGVTLGASPFSMRPYLAIPLENI
jgi:outer membrane receptor for ferrienterochelin and colicins